MGNRERQTSSHYSCIIFVSRKCKSWCCRTKKGCIQNLGKPSEQNDVIKHEKHLKEKSFKDIDDKCSGITPISRKQNTVKDIESNKSPFKDIDDKFSGITVISRKQNTVKGIESKKKITILRHRFPLSCFPCFWYLYFS